MNLLFLFVFFIFFFIINILFWVLVFIFKKVFGNNKVIWFLMLFLLLWLGFIVYYYFVIKLEWKVELERKKLKRIFRNENGMFIKMYE